MGIVLNQSLKNTIITYLGFGIGAINTIYLYPVLLEATYYALINYVLSAAAILVPFLGFGMQNTLVKFYSQCQNEKERDIFLSFTVMFPLVLCIPFGLLGGFFYEEIGVYLSRINPIVRDYLWLVPFVGLSMAYFEIFYAWLRVHMHSVFGNFIKEVGLRIFSFIGLISVYYKWITVIEFVYITAFVYFLACMITMLYAFGIKRPKFQFSKPKKSKAILEYTFYIILSGTVATLLLDIDKMILNQYIKIENIAYYSVATYIALVISVPSKAMFQITYPITAQLMHEHKHDQLDELYKKSSINLQVVGGLVFLCILVNINQLYEMVPKEYGGGVSIVFLVGFSKYLDLLLGNNLAIIFNSKYYQWVLFLGLACVGLTIVFNMLLIPIYGITGSAIATLMSIFVYSFAKMYFVAKRMDLYPFTKNNLYSFLLTVLLFFGFYFWKVPLYPIIGIGIKSIILGLLYVYLHYYFKISTEINNTLESIWTKGFALIKGLKK